MQERENSLNPELPLTKDLNKRLIHTYNFDFDFNKAINLAKEARDTTSAHKILAQSYRYMTDDQRDFFWKTTPGSLRFIEGQTALSLATKGDFSMIPQVLSNVSNENDREDFIPTLIKIANEQKKYNSDPEETINTCFNLLQSPFTDKIGSQNYYWIGSVARNAKNLGINPDTFIKSLIEDARKSDKNQKYISESKYELGRLSAILIDDGFIKEGLNLIKEIGANRYQHIGKNQLALAYVKNGEIDRGIRLATSKNDRLNLLATATLIKATQGEDHTPYLNRALKLAQQSESFNKSGIYSMLGKAEFYAGNNPLVFFEKSLSSIEAFKTPIGDLNAVEKLIQLEAETIGVRKSTLERAKSLTDSLYHYVEEEKDKIDRIEALMSGEEITATLINIGEIDLARHAMKKTVELYTIQDDEEDSSVFVLETTARIAAKEAEFMLDETALQQINSNYIDSLLKSGNSLTHKAIGYLHLIDKETFYNLPPHTQIGIATGLKESQKITEEIPTPVEIHKKNKTPMTTRALVETSVNSAITTPDELIYVLEDEIKAGNDNNVARIIKGLIEMNDKKGKELATKLFMNEDLDPHLRIYVARKLCDSGHWDRQIISYFRNYEKGGKREKPVVDIKIDSLSAIINQMHTTPNIEIYKILEKTRLALDREKTNKLAQFGNTIFQIPDTDLKEKLEIFSVWSEEFNDGKLNDEKIAKLTETFIKLSRAEQKYYSTHNIDHRNPSIISKVKEYYKHKNILYTHESICQLLENGVFPTQPLIELSKQEPHSISLTLSALKNRTDDGFFDPGNIIQRDIEYTKYMMLMGDKKDVNYTSFSKLEHKKEETELRELTLQEQKEAEAASFEAARVFWLIKDRIDQGKKVTVVGNRRYGDNFVVEPLRYYLEEIGAQVSSYKIGSSGTNENTIVDVFPESFINGLIQETPDIFIVDGTPNFLDKNSNPRMPASINAYINWFYAFNEASGNQDEDIKNLKNNTEYNMLVNKILEHTPVNPYELSFYPESDNEQIVVGTYVVKKQNLSKRNPRVTMINAVVDPNKDSLFPEYLKEHKPGYLDDPDQYVRGSKQVIMFTNNGIRQTHIGRGNEAEFVNSIQNHMINVLPRMIRATDPFFT